MIGRLLHGCESIQEVGNMFVLSKLLSTCPPDCTTYVQLKQPKSVVEAAYLIQD